MSPPSSSGMSTSHRIRSGQVLARQLDHVFGRVGRHDVVAGAELCLQEIEHRLVVVYDQDFALVHGRRYSIMAACRTVPPRESSADPGHRGRRPDRPVHPHFLEHGGYEVRVAADGKEAGS
jgi:hypothetical protein